MNRVAFLGPTLPAGEAPPGVLVRPPARQGDIFRAVVELNPVAIGLIDGVFLDVPAVWHREILWALHRGAHVLGAASMGALRAAELDGFGMRGVGVVYRAYRDGRFPGFGDLFEDDDEVAVVHAPSEAGGAALSDAMVDLRATLRAAVAARVADAADCAALVAEMKARPFADRSVSALAAAAGGALGAWIAANPVRQKAADARALLAELMAIGEAPFQPAFRFTRAMVWERFLATRRAPPPALERLRRADPEAWRLLRREAVGRLAALSGLPPASEPEAREALDRFRIAHGLVRYEDIQAWLAQNEADAGAMARLMREEAALELAPDSSALDAAMLDLLRLSGRFGAAE